MGKKFLGVIAFAAIAVAAGWNYQQNEQEVELSDLALDNVEVLARGEHASDRSDDFTTMTCLSNEVHIIICILLAVYNL